MATWFEYDYCRDLQATRAFYTELLGLDLVWDEPTTFGVVHDQVQLVYTQSDSAPTITADWAFQPGWGHGQLPDAPAGSPVRSLSIALEPAKFRAAVAALSGHGYESLRPEPAWVGYWSYVVRDPNGKTIELSDPTSPGPEQ